MTTLKLAVPTMGEAGLEAQRAGHFGHCGCFTLATITDGEVTEVTCVENPPHEEGGCLRPVGLLADAGADAIVAAGMGGRPLMGFNQAGVEVYYAGNFPTVGQSVQAFIEGRLPAFTPEHSCGGH